MFSRFFVYLLQKSLNVEKSFVCNVLTPPQYRSAILPIIQHSLLMAGSAELVDLAQTEGAS